MKLKSFSDRISGLREGDFCIIIQGRASFFCPHKRKEHTAVRKKRTSLKVQSQIIVSKEKHLSLSFTFKDVERGMLLNKKEFKNPPKAATPSKPIYE